jgi:hypothetical protein
MRKAAKNMKCRPTIRSRKLSMSIYPRPVSRTVSACSRASIRLGPLGCHTWRATGVTVYRGAGSSVPSRWLHMSRPRTTKLYDRTKDEIAIGEVERIQL